MGYTHCWTQARNFDKATWGTVVKDVEKIARASRVPLDGPNADDRCLMFNGVGDDGHETMVVSLKRTREYPGAALGWSFCKTARKPYDVVVTAVLTYLSAKHGYRVETDGDAEDWTAGVELANRALPGSNMTMPEFKE